jgi:putative ABC transport system permease protein
MSSLWSDIRYGLRVLGKRPVSTSAILLTLALAIGANSSIFSVVNGVLLSPLPFKSPDRLLAIRAQAGDTDRGDISPADFRDFQAQARSFAGIAATTTYWSVNLTGSGDPERLSVAVVSSNLLSVLGVAPERGHGFEPQHDQPGGERAVLLGHGIWQRRFGSDPGIVGRSITLNGEGYAVLGVMPEEFRFPDRDSELLLPLSFLGKRAERRDQYFLSLVGRLKPGVGADAARSELEGIARQIAAQYPDSHAGRSVRLMPLRDAVVGDVRPALYILLGAVGCVLLIACTNVASLMLAQALHRQREIALRTALGAGRLQIVRQMLVESLLLALAGGALGLLLARWGLSALLSLSTEIPRADEIGIDGRVLAFGALLSLITGLMVGLLPALRASRPDLNESLKEGGRTTGRRSSRLNGSLVAAEIALSLVLLIGAGLLIKSFVRLLEVQPGFNPAHAVTMRVSLPDASYSGYQKRLFFFQQLMESVAGMPGVQAVGATSRLPMTQEDITSQIHIEGSRDRTPPEAGLRMVSQGYFRAMEIPLLQGRVFTDADSITSQTGASAIINRTMARRFWSGQAIGKRFKMGADEKAPWITVVGVVGDIRHLGLEKEPEPEVYLASSQTAPAGMTLVVRTAGDPLAVVSAIRKEVAKLDPALPAYDIETLQQILSRSIAQRRFTMLLLALFAAIALILAAVGIYGVIAQWVANHRHELGTRLALGAQRQQILRLVLRRGMALTGVGLVLGLVAAFWMSKTIEKLLFQIGSNDPTTFVAVPLFLAAVALLACLFPALKAAQSDPMVALRYE